MQFEPLQKQDRPLLGCKASRGNQFLEAVKLTCTGPYVQKVTFSQKTQTRTLKFTEDRKARRCQGPPVLPLDTHAFFSRARSTRYYRLHFASFVFFLSLFHVVDVFKKEPDTIKHKQYRCCIYRLAVYSRGTKLLAYEATFHEET